MTPEQWQAGGGMAGYRGHSIFVREAGEGPWLVLLHGFPTSSWDWAPVWDGLVRDFRVLAFDFIGFGFSAKPLPYAYSLLDQADLVESLAAARGIAEAHVLAHDYGDTVAQELMARAAMGRLGFKLRSVCMLNGGVLYGHHRPRIEQRLLPSPLGPLAVRFMGEQRFHRSFAAIFGAQTRPTETALGDFWRVMSCNGGLRVLPYTSRYLRERRTHFLRWCTPLMLPPAPLRLVFGEDDPVSGRHMSNAVCAIAPRTDLVRLRGIGHYPQCEAPETVLDAYRAFHAGIVRRSAGSMPA